MKDGGRMGKGGELEMREGSKKRAIKMAGLLFDIIDVCIICII